MPPPVAQHRPPAPPAKPLRSKIASLQNFFHPSRPYGRVASLPPCFRASVRDHSSAPKTSTTSEGSTGNYRRAAHKPVARVKRRGERRRRERCPIDSRAKIGSAVTASQKKPRRGSLSGVDRFRLYRSDKLCGGWRAGVGQRLRSPHPEIWWPACLISFRSPSTSTKPSPRFNAKSTNDCRQPKTRLSREPANDSSTPQKTCLNQRDKLESLKKSDLKTSTAWAP